jgi:endonuclease/exonuclease/phosphatase family metal-dependent hydrolase
MKAMQSRPPRRGERPPRLPRRRKPRAGVRTLVVDVGLGGSWGDAKRVQGSLRGPGWARIDGWSSPPREWLGVLWRQPMPGQTGVHLCSGWDGAKPFAAAGLGYNDGGAMKRSRFAPMCLGVMICAAFAAVMGRAPAAAQQPKKAETEPRGVDLRVMSFNIRYGTAPDGDNQWKNRKGLVYDLLKESGCEVIGLQEALRGQVDEILGELPAYRDFGVGRDDGKHAGERSSILYNAQVLALDADDTSRGTFWLSDTPEVVASRSWGNSIPRVVTFAKFVHTGSGETFWVYNTHFDHASAQSRAKSAAALLNHIGLHAGDSPVIVMGDFNAGEKSEPMRVLLSHGDPAEVGVTWSGLTDTFRALHPDTEDVGTFNGFGGSMSGEKIDAVLITRHFEPLEAAIDRRMPGGKYPSDHWPVTASVRLKPKD